MIMNVGTTDSFIRMIIGTCILLWGAYDTNWWGTLGVLVLLSSLMNWDPIFAVLGFNGRTKEQQAEEAQAAIKNAESHYPHRV